MSYKYTCVKNSLIYIWKLLWLLRIKNITESKPLALLSSWCFLIIRYFSESKDTRNKMKLQEGDLQNLLMFKKSTVMLPLSYMINLKFHYALFWMVPIQGKVLNAHGSSPVVIVLGWSGKQMFVKETFHSRIFPSEEGEGLGQRMSPDSLPLR